MDPITLFGLQDELQKIAESVEESEKKRGITSGQALAGGLVAGTGGLLGGELLGGVAGSSLGLLSDRLGKGETTPEHVEKLRAAMGTKAPVFHPPPSGMMQSHFVVPSDSSDSQEAAKLLHSDPNWKTILREETGIPEDSADLYGKVPIVFSPTSQHPSSLAHELGHEKLYRSRLGRALIDHGDTVSNLGAIGATAAAAIADPDSAVSKYAPIVGGLSALPQIVNEGLASYHGYKGMQAAGIPTSGSLKNLAPAFLSYVAGAGLKNVGAPIIARKLRKHFKEKSLALNKKLEQPEDAQ